MKEMDTTMIRLTFADGSERNVPEGTVLSDLAKEDQGKHGSSIVAAKVNNDIKELTFRLRESSDIEFIDLTNDDGIRIYKRSLHFILIKAVHDLFPERKVVISHSISKGIYCEIKGNGILTEEDVKRIETRMGELVRADLPFVKHVMSVEEAKEIFVKSGRMDRFQAIEHRRKPYVTVYSCDGLYDYFYGYMVPSTGYIQKFSLKFYSPGVILMAPEKSAPDKLPGFKEQKKLFNIFMEYKKWGRILGVGNVGALNDMVKAGQVGDIIRISEALHEKKIAQIADLISKSEHKKRIILIAGPSSSGKTTFAQRLAIQLRVNGLKPVNISLDDYFVDREKTPKDENGDFDFEALEAIDVELFNIHLAKLIQGEEVGVPTFCFPKGCRDCAVKKLRVTDNQPLIIEGIHGLNEKLTSTIPRESKFKIYVSALTSMNIDDHNRITTTDTRIIRRIVRDFHFRGSSAVSTINRWPSVRRGEERNIFPFQEEADIMFNSSLVFELGVLKTMAEPLLADIDRNQPEYSEAKRLIEFLSYFLPIATKQIPANSIIREFIGESCFY